MHATASLRRTRAVTPWLASMSSAAAASRRDIDVSATMPANDSGGHRRGQLHCLLMSFFLICCILTHKSASGNFWYRVIK